MEKIEGARLIGSTWHYNKRVPRRLVEAYGLPEFKRGTMGTKDPDTAKRLARAMLNELDELEAKLDSTSERVKVFGDLTPKERERLQSDIARDVSNLPLDQQRLIQAAGGVMKALGDMQAHEVSHAFLAGAEGAEFTLMDDMGVPYDPDEREQAEAQDEAVSKHHERKSKALRAALSAAGVVSPAADAAMGLRGVLERFCEHKGYVHTANAKNKTRGQYEYAVRRFIEYHGDIPLADLRKKHLADFGRDFLKLPVSSRADVRPLVFRDAVRIADREDLPRVSQRTRDQNLTLLKSLMAYAVNEELFEGEDRWAGYSPTVAKGKVSASRQKKRHVFSRSEVQRIAEHTTQTRDPSTIDFWGPLFGAFHGLRLEEVAQLRVNDVTTEEGLLCISVTDEAELQKVKNQNTFRTIPVHFGLVERGFERFVESRRQAAGELLFMEAQRWGGELREIAHDGQGRFGTNYGSRFSRELARLAIVGYRVGYHSFRHAWTDLARNTGINPEQRRALAGRESDDDRTAPNIDRTENSYGHGFSIAVLSNSLNRLRPFDGCLIG